ncbi:signal peptidase II [Candidatus Dependentiae bacterium]|nr:signal peptidase II [Candidatus Dependentiae bacterium]
MNKKLKVIVYFLIFVSAFIIDRLTKIWALRNLIAKDIKVFDHFNLTLVWNRGVSWGLFSFESAIKFNFLSFIILFMIYLFFVHTYKAFKKGNDIFFEVLIFAGAFSNVYDRFFYRGVVDFLDFHVGNWHWPVFNLADVFIVIGVFGILGRYFFDVYISKNKRN